MKTVLAIDVAKGKSTVSLITDCGEVLIEPYEINHSKNDFYNLNQKISKFNLDDISVIMESTGIYHRPIERFFLENNFKVFVVNPIYGKIRKRNLRKTKTDKEDCFNLVNLFLTNTFKEYSKPDQLYLDLNALSRQYFALDELCVNLKNRYKNLVYLCFPEYEELFKGNTIYSSIALKFIEKYPHANIISNTRIDKLQNFFKKQSFSHWKSKPIKIKEAASNSYPSVDMNDEIVSNLSQISRLVNEYQKAIDIVKYKIVFLSKKSKYFETINSIYKDKFSVVMLNVEDPQYKEIVDDVALTGFPTLYIIDKKYDNRVLLNNAIYLDLKRLRGELDRYLNIRERLDNCDKCTDTDK